MSVSQRSKGLDAYREQVTVLNADGSLTPEIRAIFDPIFEGRFSSAETSPEDRKLMQHRVQDMVSYLRRHDLGSNPD